MRFILFVIHNLNDVAADDEMAKINTFNQKLRNERYWIAAEGIAHPSEALMIGNRDGVGRIDRGSVLDGPDFYNGFWIIEVPSREVAEDLALEGSLACNRRIGLRPYL